MKKVILAAVAAMTMSTIAQASWGVDGCIMSEKFTMKYTFPNGSTLYANSEMHADNKGYVKIPSSPYYTYKNTSCKFVQYQEITSVKVCDIAADRFIDDSNYDDYKEDASSFDSSASSALHFHNQRQEAKKVEEEKKADDSKLAYLERERVKLENQERIIAEQKKAIDIADKAAAQAKADAAQAKADAAQATVVKELQHMELMAAQAKVVEAVDKAADKAEKHQKIMEKIG